MSSSLTYSFFLLIYLFISIFLCTIVLVQEGKSGSLGAMFGGDSSSSMFGTSTVDVLRKITFWSISIFLSFSIVLSSWTSKLGSSDKSNDYVTSSNVVVDAD